VLAATIVVLLSAGVIGAAARSDRRHSPTTPVAAPAAGSTTTTPAGGAPPSSLSPVGPLAVPPGTVPAVTPQRPGLAPAVIAAMVNPAVVDINARLTYQHAIAAGTGMVLTASGIVLTNNHVIAGATSITARSVGTGRTYTAHVVGVSAAADVAVLQVDGASGLAAITAGDSSAVAPGDPVVAIGNAGGAGGTPSVTTGTVEAVNQSIIASDPSAGTSEALDGLIESNAGLQPGDSGGPLVDGTGQVIGMNTAAAAATRAGSSVNVSFAIPIHRALSVAQQLQSGQVGATVHLGLPAFLGVRIAGPGAVVSGVVNASPAAGAGLVAGDTITAIDGTVVDSGEALTAAMARFHPGQSVIVAWMARSGLLRSARVTLAAGPAG
jgi:S1-C subfamily serine protease